MLKRTVGDTGGGNDCPVVKEGDKMFVRMSKIHLQLFSVCNKVFQLNTYRIDQF